MYHRSVVCVLLRYLNYWDQNVGAYAAYRSDRDRDCWPAPKAGPVSPIVEVPLAEGGSVLIEVDEAVDGPVVRGRSAATVLPPLEQPLEHVLAGLGPTTQALLSQVRALTDSPHEIEVEFAIKLTADARIVIARAGGEANFRISMTWTHSSGEPSVGGGEEG